jgi:TPR repeat protein
MSPRQEADEAGMMGTSKQQRGWTGCAAPVLLAILSWAGNGVPAATAGAAMRGAPADIGRCQANVRKALALAPILRQSDERSARLLDARRYRPAASALRSAVSRYADAWAGYTLGNLYAAGLGVPRSADTAFRWYLWSAERGDWFAQRRVANAYLHGEGTQRNAAEAAYWFRIGIAPFELARMYYGLSQTYARGHLAPVDRNKEAYYLGKSLADLRELAKEPNGEAAYYLGMAYEYGDGVTRDRAKATGFLCRAAALHYAPAAGAIRRLSGPR